MFHSKARVGSRGLMFGDLIVFSLAELSKSVSGLTKSSNANYFGKDRVMTASNLFFYNIEEVL